MPDVILGVLYRHRLRCVDHRRLTRVIPRQPRPWPDPSRARNVHEDASLALLLHVRNDHLGGVVDTPAIDVETHVKVRVRHVVGRFVPVRRAGVVDHDVTGPIGVNSLLEKGFPVVEFGDVGEVEGTVEVFRGCFAKLGLEVGNHDFGAFLDELLGDAFAETLACEGGVGYESRPWSGIWYVPPPVTMATFPESLPDISICISS